MNAQSSCCNVEFLLTQTGERLLGEISEVIAPTLFPSCSADQENFTSFRCILGQSSACEEAFVVRVGKNCQDSPMLGTCSHNSSPSIQAVSSGSLHGGLQGSFSCSTVTLFPPAISSTFSRTVNSR